MRRILCVLFLVGCGGKLSEEEFVNEYTRSYCAWEQQCVDPAMAVFDGAEGVEACEAAFGEEMVNKAFGCKLERDFAELCLQGMAELSCPEDGQEPAEVLPQDCELSWKKCALTGEDLDDDA
jgi:hypothetical protein